MAGRAHCSKGSKPGGRFRVLRCRGPKLSVVLCPVRARNTLTRGVADLARRVLLGEPTVKDWANHPGALTLKYTGARRLLTDISPCHTHCRLHTATGTARPLSYTHTVTREVILHTPASVDVLPQKYTRSLTPYPLSLYIPHQNVTCLSNTHQTSTSPHELGQPQQTLSTIPTFTLTGPS